MFDASLPDDSTPSDTKGTHLPGYAIIRKINSGGMASVFLATQLSLGRIVALKIMKPELDNDPEFHERFQREGTIVGQLSHPNIIPIYDIGRYNGMNYMSMEYLPGGSLDQALCAGLSVNKTIDIIIAIARALDHAHTKGYVHRDIKPENILFRADGSPVLTDFGIARMFKTHSTMTLIGSVIGTPSYMSPEQAKGESIDGRSDLYSLGVLLYEMLTGMRPFRSEHSIALALQHIDEKPANLPIQYFAFQEIIDKLLAKKPSQRFQNGRELIARLEHIKHSTHPLVAQSKGDTDSTQLLKAISYTLVDSARIVIQKYLLKISFKRTYTTPELLITPERTLEETRILTLTERPNTKPSRLFKNIVMGLAGLFIVSILVYEFTASRHKSPSARQDLFSPDNKKSTLPLKINTLPANAQVRLLNTSERYFPEMQLAPGYYHLEISAPGYSTKSEWVQLTNPEQVSTFALAPADATERFTNPEMVEIAAGTLALASNSGTNTEIKNISVDKNFYIGKYEVTFDEYDYFADATKRNLPDDEGWGRGNRPAINISWQDAQDYVEWLSKTTGKHYRLPTASEWEFAARAKNIGTFWWGDDATVANNYANCRQGCQSRLRSLFGNKTKPVGSYPPNNFGLHDTAGNAAEWVADCGDSANQKHNNCELHILRGGAYTDSLANISNQSETLLGTNQFNKTTGFRILLEIAPPKKAEPTKPKQTIPQKNPIQRFFHRLFG